MEPNHGAGAPNREPALIRRLTPDDAADFQAIRREALIDSPFSFAASPGDDLAESLDWVVAALRSPDQAVLGAFGPRLVGTAGVYRTGGAKFAHKAHIWGVYVRPEARRRGLARRLVEAAIEFAETLPGIRQVQLTANAGSAAAALYRSLGFVSWGIEPAGMLVGGVESDEEHMALILPRPSVPPGR